MAGTIVFIGDSITDSRRRTDARGLGGGYVNFVATTLRERGDDAAVVNTGISGDGVAELRERWQRDALDHRPTVLSVYIGVNDTLAAFFRGYATPVEVFERDYTDILERAVAAGVPRLIVVEPFYLDNSDEWAHWREGNAFARSDLDRKRSVVRALADRFGAAFVALQDAVDQAAKERGPAVVAPDGVHPSAFGASLITRLWLAAYDTRIP
jgi:lysophospholipase L1-like esterase